MARNGGDDGGDVASKMGKHTIFLSHCAVDEVKGEIKGGESRQTMVYFKW